MRCPLMQVALAVLGLLTELGAQSVGGSATLLQRVDGEMDSAYVHSGFTGAQLYSVIGPDPGGYFGQTAAAAGDVNGDGVPDILVGAPWTAPAGVSAAGSAFVLDGSTGAQIHRFDGTGFLDNFGMALPGAGDVDGDGVGDYLVGASSAEIPPLNYPAGRAYLYSGATGALLHVFQPVNYAEEFGAAVAGAGDVNGDGRAEILGGSVWTDAGYYQRGAAYLYAFAPFLVADRHRISAAAGGTVLYSLDFPVADAGLSYAMLGSVTSTGPTDLAGLDVPLTSGDWFWNTMFSGNAPAPYGVLDASGDATCTLTVPAGAGTSFVGTTFFLAAVAYTPPATPVRSSAVVSLTMEP